MFRSTFCVGRPFFRFGRSDETFLFGKRIIFIENFAGTNFHSIFAVPKRRFRRRHAEIAQLVERNLAKVEVAGPSPVFRSNNKGRTDSVLPLLLMQGMPGACLRDLKAPLSGAGGVNNESRPSLAQSASASPVFRSREAKERRIARFSFLFFGGGRDSTPATSRRPFQGPGVSTTNRGRHSRIARVRVPFSAPEWQKKGESQDSPFCFSGGERDSTPATSRRPFQGPGVSTTNRGRHSRYVRVPFSASEKREESCDSSLFVLSVWYRGLCRFRVSDADSGKV